MNLTLDNRIAFAQARDLLLEGQSVQIRVQGQSMLPFFRSGSTITLRPLRDGDLRRGNVVMALAPSGYYVVHRIIRVTDGTVTLLGDGNTVGTATMPISQVYGIVDCAPIHRMLARIWLWMRPVRKYPLWIRRRICRK